MDPDFAAALAPGYTVYTSDNEKLGEIVAIHSAVMHVQKGRFLTKDCNVPYTAVARVDTEKGEVILSVPSDAVAAQNWELHDDETSDEPEGADYRDAGMAPGVATSGGNLVSPVRGVNDPLPE